MGTDFYNQSILPWSAIIIKICRAYTNSQDEFEDYYQEVCLQIWRSRDKFTGKSEWSTWIYRISLNVCLTNIRKQKSHREKMKSASEHIAVQATQVSAKDNRIDELYAAIKQLRDMDRAIILFYLEEKSYREIADVIGISSNNIGVRITRIKEQLSHMLTRKENTNEKFY